MQPNLQVAAGAEVNVNADWEASGGDAQILNKPTTLSGYGIIDAKSIRHVANGISSADIIAWNTSYGWGNHAGRHNEFPMFHHGMR